ncbi:MAG: hypothetical protein LC775_01680, partial [Acidobacteria bacterium]|nr:hypothetical protein [Acidobacteriota bacterium]
WVTGMLSTSPQAPMPSQARNHPQIVPKSLIYELEVVDEQGIVWDLEIDARTGKLLEKKHDD